MGDLSGLKCTQSNTLCSGFVNKTLSWMFWKLFPTGTYVIIGTTCVEFENVMKSTTKKLISLMYFVLFKNKKNYYHYFTPLDIKRIIVQYERTM